MTRRALLLTIGTIIVLLGLRFGLLPIAFPGFYIDETASQKHVASFIEQQTNAQGEAWPLYSQSLGGGFTTPIYLYPTALWASVFGSDDISLRVFSQVVTVAAIGILAASMRLLAGRKAALITAIVGLILPWNWVQGSLVWDPIFVPLAIALAVFGWALLYTQTAQGRRVAGYILLPLGCMVLAYTYPPYWAVAPLLLIGAYSTLFVKKRVSLRAIIITVVALTIAALPLASFILAPGTLGRSSSISIFSGVSLFEAAGRFMWNILQMVNPVYLFIAGDSNLRQSNIAQGMLGIASLAPLFALLIAFIRYKRIKSNILSKESWWIIGIMLSGFIVSLIGSALTNEGQPHSLRSCGAWIFAVVLISYGWIVLSQGTKKWLITTLAIAVISTVLYVADLALFYPSRSAPSFSSQRTNYLV